MTIDLCWQSFLDSVHEYPALWTAIGFLIFWTLRFMVGHKLHLITTCASRHRRRDRWYHVFDRISPFNLHDWQIYDEDWRKNRNMAASGSPLVPDPQRRGPVFADPERNEKGTVAETLTTTLPIGADGGHLTERSNGWFVAFGECHMQDHAVTGIDQ